MSIVERIQKIKKQHRELLEDLFIVLLVIFVGLSSFGLGRLSALEETKQPVELIGKEAVTAISILSDQALEEGAIAAVTESGTVVASKNGTKYHYPWCSGAQRMKEENKIWFESIEDARIQGYSPAANCKGLR